jgi:hypothetical protein
MLLPFPIEIREEPSEVIDFAPHFVAKKLAAGEYQPMPFTLGGPFGLDAARLPACALGCGSPFPAEGEACGWWNERGGWMACHTSCTRIALQAGEPPAAPVIEGKPTEFDLAQFVRRGA